MSNNFMKYFTLILLAVIIGTQAYNLYQTRLDYFPGVWIVRISIVLLIISFIASFALSAFYHRFSVDQIPSCCSVAYFKFRWYIFTMAGLALSAIPVYMAILHKNHQKRLLILLGSQIQVNLFMVLLTIGLDALSRYLHLRQVQKSESTNNGGTATPTRSASAAQPQFGYFSPKAKGPQTPTVPKNPFDSGTFRYAR